MPQPLAKLEIPGPDRYVTVRIKQLLGAEKSVPVNKPDMSHQGGPNIEIRNKFKYQIP